MKLKNYTSGVPVDRSVWADCYSEGWGDRIVPEAFSHPAKASYNLLLKIFSHAKEQGWISKDSLVLDPFGGIGTTGIVGAYAGHRVLCCELEQKFVDLGLKNFELHRRNWETLGVPFPVIVQGDSRKLSEVLRGADCLVSSPPWQGSQEGAGKAGPSSGMWKGYQPGFKETYESSPDSYGESPGQLGAMKAGDLIISSPPYAGAIGNRQHEGDQEKYLERQKRYNRKHPEYKRPPAESMAYPASPGQLGSMPPGDLIVSSPPYEGAIVRSRDIEQDKERMKRKGIKCQPSLDEYGEGKDNLGNSQGDTFWTAARLIIERCFQVLKPGGHAVWICKDFVRAGKRVPFSDDWLRLNESCGFELICRHRAMLVKEHEVGDLFDGKKTKSLQRKSFFRRLHERRYAPDDERRINWEDVLCLKKT